MAARKRPEGMALVKPEKGDPALPKGKPSVDPAKSPSQLIAHIAGALEEMRSATAAEADKEKYRQVVAALVFAYWQAKFGHPRSLLDKSRERLIINRLREAKDNASDLLWALDGALRDDWVMGRAKESTKRFDSLDLLLRNRERIEKYGEMMKGFREDRPHPLAVKYLMPKEGE